MEKKKDMLQERGLEGADTSRTPDTSVRTLGYALQPRHCVCTHNLDSRWCNTVFNCIAVRIKSSLFIPEPIPLKGTLVYTRRVGCENAP